MISSPIKYLLIDNCSLRDLVSQYGFSEYLIKLKELINHNKIRLVTHPHILQEWEKHAAKWRREKTGKLLGYNKAELKKIPETSTLLPKSPILTTDHIDAQFIEIDQLLSHALLLQTPIIIENEFRTRYAKSLAPFHNKKNSLNDWELLGSFCHFAEINGMQEIYFISANTGEFGDVNEPTRLIHTDIKERFPKLAIHYFTEFTAFFTGQENIGMLPIHFLDYNIVPCEKFNFKTTFKKTVLDSLYFIYHELYGEVNFIPLHILKNYHPFAKNEESYTYFANFTLHGVSETLVDFFKNITIHNGTFKFKDETLLVPIKDYQEKTEYVLNKLTRNLIFHISGTETHTRVCTHLFPDKPCNCISCRFNRLEFFEVFELLHVSPSTYQEKLQHAYIHYQLGNYALAYSIYDEIDKTAASDHKYLIYFISRYNQRHLSRFMENFFYNKNVQAELCKELSKIDMLELAVKLKSLADYNMLTYIAQEDYFTDAFQGIIAAVKKIRENYQNQLNGGWSHNDHLTEVMVKFALVDQFLNTNYIIYDQYDNFTNLFELVTEGLFASYAISPSRGSRLDSLDDYWATKFIIYGRPKYTRKLAAHYNLKDIEYRPSLTSKNALTDQLKNIIDIIRSANKNNIHGIDDDNLFFGTRLEGLFEMTLTMVSLLKVPRSLVQKAATLTLAYMIIKGKKKRLAFYEALDYFFKTKGSYLSAARKLLFLKELIFNCKSNNSNTLFSLIASYKADEIIALSTKHIREITAATLQPCSKCKQHHEVINLTFLYRHLDATNKAIVASEIKKSLKANFNFAIFYGATINDIIKPNKTKILELITGFVPPKNNVTMRTVFSGADDHTNNYADELINLCFKSNIDTTALIFNKISKIHPYYKWVLDMQHFDYKKFNAEWVLSYQTKFYLRKMAGSKSLIIALRKSIKENPHESIERVLLNITNFYTEIQKI